MSECREEMKVEYVLLALALPLVVFALILTKP